MCAKLKLHDIYLKNGVGVDEWNLGMIRPSSWGSRISRINE